MKSLGLAVCYAGLLAGTVFPLAQLDPQSPGLPSVGDPKPRDSDQRFLREMIDHHEGLIYLVHEAMQKPISEKAHAVLDGFDVTEDAEKREMVEALRFFFGDSYQGKVTKQDRSAADSVLRQSGNPTFDRMASSFVINHHQRGIKIVDAFLSRIRRPRVRELAVGIKKKEKREMAFHQRRLAAD